MPNRHTLVWHPIADLTALRAIDAMVVMASSMCAEGPGSISANLFWYRDGALRTLPTRETDEHYEFVPRRQGQTPGYGPSSQPPPGGAPISQDGSP